MIASSNTGNAKIHDIPESQKDESTIGSIPSDNENAFIKVEEQGDGKIIPVNNIAVDETTAPNEISSEIKEESALLETSDIVDDTITEALNDTQPVVLTEEICNVTTVSAADQLDEKTEYETTLDDKTSNENENSTGRNNVIQGDADMQSQPEDKAESSIENINRTDDDITLELAASNACTTGEGDLVNQVAVENILVNPPAEEGNVQAETTPTDECIKNADITSSGQSEETAEIAPTDETGEKEDITITEKVLSEGTNTAISSVSKETLVHNEIHAYEQTKSEKVAYHTPISNVSDVSNLYCGFQRIPSSQIVLGCIHDTICVMKSEMKRTNPTRYGGEYNSTDITTQPLYVRLKDLQRQFSAIDPQRMILTGLGPTDTHGDSSEEGDESSHENNPAKDDDDDASSDGSNCDEDDSESEDDEDNGNYLTSFCDGIKRQDVGPAVTLSLIMALEKFMVYDILAVDPLQDKSSPASEKEYGIQLISETLALCSFDEHVDGVHKKASSDSLPSSQFTATATSLVASSPDAEKCIQKLLEVIVVTIEYSIQSDFVLEPADVTALLAICVRLTDKFSASSHLLCSTASTAANDVIIKCFQDPISGRGKESQDISSYRLSIVLKLIELLQHSNNACNVSTKAPVAVLNVLSLIRTALECTREQTPDQTERDFYQKVLFKVILSTSMHARHCSVLEASLNVFFNLWVCMRTELKYEFEVFLQFVHFRILDAKAKEATGLRLRRKAATADGSVLCSLEAREVVLESLSRICQLEPNILREIYFNYDCDATSSDLFEGIVAAFAKAVLTETTVPSVKSAPAIRPKETKTEAINPLLTGSTRKKISVVSVPSQSNDSSADPTSLNAHSQHSASTLSVSSSQKKRLPQSKEPMNYGNQIGREGILSALYSINYPQTEDDLVHQKADCDHMYYSIKERTRSGQLTVLTPEILNARKRRKLALQRIAHTFNGNVDSDEWLSLSVAEGFIQEGDSLTSPETAKVAAEILYYTHDVDKTSLGLYLSKGPDSKYPFELMVRREFAALHDFSNMTFPVALRSFLFKFRMPGEAQCIDRIMEVFSKDFFEQQSGVSDFKNADAVYVLAFSTIMLNTDLHNRTIKAEKKMTQEQFVRNNRGINAGEDLNEDFLKDLYDQIKEREIQVKRGNVDNITTPEQQEDFCTTLEVLQSRNRDMISSLFVQADKGNVSCSKAYDKEMFNVLAKPCINALSGVFDASRDDPTVVTALRGLQHLIKVSSSFHLNNFTNDVVKFLLLQGREYINKCLAQDYASPNDSPNMTGAISKISTTDMLDDDGNSIDMEHSIPEELLFSKTSKKSCSVVGSAAHKGLLALDSGFNLFRKNYRQIDTAWPAFIDCLCTLRDARALPEGLSELDDFADSNGNALPLSSYAISSKKTLDEYYRSLSDQNAARNKGWFRSLFRAGKEGDGMNIDSLSPHNAELSLGTRALLRVTEAAGVEDVVQLGSMRLPDSTIRALLATVSEYSFVEDPVREQQAIFSLELAVRALLSDRKNAANLFPHFLKTFEGILCKSFDENVESPFVVERILVAILRCSIHLYEIPELRANLRASLQLITMTLPKSYIRVIADRLACGMAIILRVSFHFFESVNEWNFIGETLDILANFTISREFVFDGIASTVEFAIPNPKEYEYVEENRPKIPVEACASISRLLIRFTLGFYKGDLSLTVPAMLCLEKVYRYKCEQMQILDKSLAKESDHGSIDPIYVAPDKEFWQNVAVAIYSCCRSADPEASRHGVECFRRLILQAGVDQIPVDKWIAIMHLMLNKQPPLTAVTSRGNTFALIGHTMSHILPYLSKKEGSRSELEDIVKQVATLMSENLQHCGNGGSSSCFEDTLQTATYLANHMVSDEWQGDPTFSSWASEILLAELERSGGMIEAYNKRDRAPAIEASSPDRDDSEVSELSGTESPDDENDEMKDLD